MAPQNKVWTLNDVSNRMGDPSSSSSFGPAPVAGPLSAPYCQPASNKDNHAEIPLYHIPNMLSHQLCKEILERILKEFKPIIQRRGYNVISISEFCCCGDGLDHVSETKMRKQPDNVLGYNMIQTYNGHKSHAIHLRLRKPRNHNQLIPWEEVAGTMAHELSHCVYQNHGKGFYKLMEEILDEHASILVNGGGFNIYTGAISEGGGVQQTRDQQEPGQRLGGNKSGKSRLLLGQENGHRLGGGCSRMDPKALRAAVAKAAERRQRLMQQTRRMIERSKEPCVIEIFDDDDDEEKDEAKPVSSKRPKTHSSGSIPTTIRQSQEEYIDLTNDDDSPSLSLGNNEWICSRCTLRNKALTLVCDACLEERKF